MDIRQPFIQPVIKSPQPLVMGPSAQHTQISFSWFPARGSVLLVAMGGGQVSMTQVCERHLTLSSQLEGGLQKDSRFPKKPPSSAGCVSAFFINSNGIRHAFYPAKYSLHILEHFTEIKNTWRDYL